MSSSLDMGDDQGSFFFEIASLLNENTRTIENTVLPLLNNFLPLLKISYHICVSLFLNALFYSFALYVYLYANTTLSRSL